MMHDREKSHSAIRAGKPTNKAGSPAAEPVEQRAGTKRNASEQSTHRTQGWVRVTQALDRVRQLWSWCAAEAHRVCRTRWIIPEKGKRCSGSRIRW
jgi:hypothetical protein